MTDHNIINFPVPRQPTPRIDAFTMCGDMVVVTLPTDNGAVPIQFTLTIPEFLSGITSAVLFANRHLAHVLDIVGVP
jgi:hypothetical protein